MFGGRHEGHEEPQRNTKTAGMGEPQIPKNTEITEKTERHRGGQRASARRTLKGRFRSLEAWFLHEDTKERKGLGTRGGLRRPGERKTENREQRARGKRAMGKALYRVAPAAVLFLLPHRLRAVFLGKRQGAKRRAAGAVSGGAAERPMEPEAVRAP